MTRPAAATRSALIFQIATGLGDAASRLALPAALLGLARDAVEPALAASTIALVASVLRAWGAAKGLEIMLARAWDSVVRAAAARSVRDLARRKEDEESVAVLVEGAHDAATHHAMVVPQAIAVVATAVGVTVASFVVLGAARSIVGGLLLALLGALAALLMRGLRGAQARAWKAFGTIIHDMRVLLDGALELRALGMEAALGTSVRTRAEVFARERGRAAAAGLRVGVLPASIGLVILVLPRQLGLREAAHAFAGPKLFEATVLGGAAAATALAAARLWETWVTALPRRKQFFRFTREGAGEVAERTERVALGDAAIEFEGFGHQWSADGVATPHAIDLHLEPRGGIAICGPNGSGKTTLLLALLGLVKPTQGHVRIGGVDAHLVLSSGRLGYVPQDPFLMPGESIAWHCRLHDEVSDDRIDDALVTVGLAASLRSRARARAMNVRDLPATELSGGERRRMAMARALQLPRDLVVLDEPEAGLDATSRGELKEMLAELAKTSRVVVVVHDTSVIPESFRNVRLPGAGSQVTRFEATSGDASGKTT